MSESFSVGDVALFYRPGSRFHLVEVVVTKGLHLSNVYDHRDGSRFLGHVYGIDAPEFHGVTLAPGSEGCCASPEQLRKRPPKQDWKQLCNLETRELETA